MERYGDGTLALDFAADGSGFAYYPNKRIAVCTTSLNGAISTTIYFNKKSRPVMCSFDALGIGSCCFLNGRPRLTTTSLGGRQFGESGDQIRSWTWLKGLESEIIFSMSENVNFKLVDRSNIVAEFTCQGISMTFQLGLILRRSDTYLSKVISKNKLGKLVLDMERVRESLKHSQEIRASQLGAAGQTASYPLPKITPQYASKVKDPETLRAIAIAGVITERVKANAFHVDIATATEMGEDRQRHVIFQDFKASDHPMFSEAKKIKSVQMGGKYLPFKALTTSYISLKKSLPCVRSSAFDTFIQSCPPEQVVMVILTASWSHESQKALTVWEQCYGRIFAEECKNGEKPPEQFGMRIVQVDFAESRLFNFRYNIKSVPMFLAFSQGKLVYAKNHMMIDPGSEYKAFAVSAEDAFRLISRCKDLAERGVFLANDFKFGFTDDEIGEGMAKRLQSVFGHP